MKIFYNNVLRGFFLITFLITGSLKAWSVMDLESRFIDPDLEMTKSIFIEVKDATLLNVLKIISKQTGLSFVAAPDVAQKRMTIYVNNVPLNKALVTVLDANDLMYEMQEDSNVFMVKAKFKTEKSKITRVYQLKYGTVDSSKLKSTIAVGGGGGSGSSTGGLEQAVKDALSPDGKLIEDTRTNSLIITDVPGQFEIIENTIAKLDVPIPEVLIEVEILDVNKSVADNVGIIYGSGNGDFQPLSFTGGKKSVNYPLSASPVPAPVYTAGSFDMSSFKATLTFIATQADTKVLARPRILTLNNETAQIQISSDTAVSLTQTTSSSTGGSGTLTANTPERYTTGTILKVTPQANLITNEVTLAISPKEIEAVPSIVSTPSNTVYDPETRSTDSILKLKDGQTMMIGGLMHKSTSKAVTKLPILGDLPWVGKVFSSSKKGDVQRELIIFLTPHIIRDNQQPMHQDDKTLSAQKALDIIDASNKAQDVNSVLNSLDKL